ncbi:MAG TPA: hypothetical protein VER03_04020 [Bryobacteraceae bacterium]|nr:hypothetical protein [Bryobacteraceae bacterium]
MPKVLKTALTVVVAILSHSAIEGADLSPKLWAGLSVYPQGPVIRGGEVERLQITFGVVNDGTTPVNAQRMSGSSRLFINGVELREWSLIVNNGGRGGQCFALRPGQDCSFSYSLARYFRKPGIYVVRWEAPNFRASELTFRVVNEFRP